MNGSKTTTSMLDQAFLGIRSRLLDIAADLDRVQRAKVDAGDPRLVKIREAMNVLSMAEPGRAERIQMIFSLPYDANWRG